MEIIIKNDIDVSEFRKRLKLRNKSATIKIELIKNEKIQFVEKKINRLYNSCGCQEGTIGLFAGALFLFLFYHKININKAVLISVTLFFTGALGKVLGLIISKYRLTKLLKVLSNLK